MRIIFSIIIALSLTSCSGASVKTQVVDYQQDKKDFEGFLAEPESVKGKVPGVLLIHEWTGLGDYVQGRTQQVASLGYVAFAMDMYGKGVRVEDHDHEKAGKIMSQYTSNKPLMISRIKKGIEVLKSNPNVDPNRIAIIGYCFGGGAAMEYALSGNDVTAVASFHGMLPLVSVKDAKKVKGKISIHHGGDDKFIPQKNIDTIQSSFKTAGVDYELLVYPGAVHAFTRPAAGTAHKAMGMAYDEEADKLSWKRLVEFFKKNL